MMFFKINVCMQNESLLLQHKGLIPRRLSISCDQNVSVFFITDGCQIDRSLTTL